MFFLMRFYDVCFYENLASAKIFYNSKCIMHSFDHFWLLGHFLSTLFVKTKYSKENCKMCHVPTIINSI